MRSAASRKAGAIVVSDIAGQLWREALAQIPDPHQVAFASRFYRYLSDEEFAGHEVPQMVDELRPELLV